MPKNWDSQNFFRNRGFPESWINNDAGQIHKTLSDIGDFQNHGTRMMREIGIHKTLSEIGDFQSRGSITMRKKKDQERHATRHPPWDSLIKTSCEFCSRLLISRNCELRHINKREQNSGLVLIRLALGEPDPVYYLPTRKPQEFQYTGDI